MMKESVEYTQGEIAEIFIFDAITSKVEPELRENLQTALNINFELYDFTMDSISNSLVQYYASLIAENGDDDYEHILTNLWGNEFWADDFYGNYALGCDIILSNKDNKDKKIYIEIKSHYENKVEFYLTPNEYECAKKHLENYYVIHVRNMKEKKENWIVEVLPQKFWENERFEMKETVQDDWEDDICTEKLRYFFSERI